MISNAPIDDRRRLAVNSAGANGGTHQGQLAPRMLVVFLAMVGAWMFAAPAHAALTFELRSGDAANNTQKLIIDSNKCPSQGPTAMYVGGLVTNTGGTAVQNVSGTMSGLNGNVFFAGGQPGTQFVGTLAPGASISLYWLVGMSCNAGATATPVIQLTSDTVGSSSGLTLTISKAISANAGGQVVGSNLGPGAVVGQTIFFDADYDFGGTGVGDEYFLQPSGSQNFNAACFRLVGSEVTNSNVAAAPIGLKDDLYVIQPSSQPGNNFFISVRYFFQYQCSGASTTARPYAAQTSGTKIKYTGNYDGAGSVQIGFPGATNPFTISKTVSESQAFIGASGNLTYTITVSNPSVFASEISRIVDVLPGDMTFTGLTANSDVTAANSSSIPAAGSGGTLDFVGILGQSYAIAAGGSVTLQYTASRPTTVGTFTNTAQARFGSASTPTASATYNQTAITPLSVSKVSALISDPVNAETNPFHIPGALLEYTIVVGNPNAGAIDPDSVAVTDIAPGETRLCLNDLGGAGSGPIQFIDGTTSSALTYTFTALNDAADDLEFSNDNGATFDYAAIPDGQGCDAAITHFRVKPTGAFAASSEFTLKARFLLD